MNIDLLKSISNVVLKEAPNLAGLLLGPSGEIGVSLLEKLFGVDAIDLPNTIAVDPDAAVKLKQLDVQLAQTDADDRSNARDREREVIKLTGKRDWVVDFIAISVIVGFFLMCILITIFPQTNSDHDILYMLIGQLTSGFLLVLGYYFGSSKQNQK